MKLTEVLNDQQKMERKQIEQWLLKHKIYNHRIDGNGVVHVQGRVDIRDDFEQLPVQFGNVDGMFIMRSPNLISLVGSPLRLGNGQHAYLAEGPLLSSLQGITPVAKEHSVYTSSLKSIRGIHKHIKSSDLIYISDEATTRDDKGTRVTEGGLGLLLIKPLESGWQVAFEDDDISDLLWQAKHSGKDIHTIQDELIDQGYEEYAQL